jgi:two-component system, OmpR family, sensor histidine kinase KdpD
MKRLSAPLQWLLAVVAAAAATVLGLVLDAHMSVAGLAMVYLVAVAATAVTLDRAPAVLASLLCVSALNFFFVPPRHTFEVDGAEYWWTLLVLLALSVMLNTLIGWLRTGRARAELGAARTAQLHALSEALAQCRGWQPMAQRAADWLHEALGRPCAVFVRAGEGDALACLAAGAPVDGFHPASVRWALEHGRRLGRGCDDWPDLPLWCAPFARREPTGAVQLLVDRGVRPDVDEQQHWLALVHQVALSVERERAGETAQVAQERAQAEAARNTLLASLSHDLRTPLAGILGSASALRTQGDAMAPGQRDRLLANLEDEARDLTLLADNILQMARLSQPHSQLRLQWEAVEEILGAAVARMRRRWPQARIELKVTPELPPVRAEATLLAQLVANLVDNAVRHGSEPPQIVVRAGRSREGVFIAVRDHGSGLPPGDPQELFGRFGRPGRAGHSGLGLAICRLIAQAHGGQLEARRCDPGSEFRLDLPVIVQAVPT